MLYDLSSHRLPFPQHLIGYTGQPSSVWEGDNTWARIPGDHLAGGHPHLPPGYVVPLGKEEYS